MRKFGSVQISFWQNSNIQDLSDQAKLLAIYLLTGPHSNMLGCFRLPEAYVSEDLKWDKLKLKNALSELVDIEFIARDEVTLWIVIINFLKWNPIQNINQGIGIKKIFNVVPSKATVMKPLIKSLLDYGTHLDENFVKCLQNKIYGSETLSQGYLPDKEQNKIRNRIRKRKKYLCRVNKKIRIVVLKNCKQLRF